MNQSLTARARPGAPGPVGTVELAAVVLLCAFVAAQAGLWAVRTGTRPGALAGAATAEPGDAAAPAGTLAAGVEAPSVPVGLAPIQAVPTVSADGPMETVLGAVPGMAAAARPVTRARTEHRTPHTELLKLLRTMAVGPATRRPAAAPARAVPRSVPRRSEPVAHIASMETDLPVMGHVAKVALPTVPRHSGLDATTMRRRP